jgi:hypothetical protein
MSKEGASLFQLLQGSAYVANRASAGAQLGAVVEFST